MTREVRRRHIRGVCALLIGWFVCWMGGLGVAWGQWVRCPSVESSLCIPGRVENRVVCQKPGGFVEYPSVSHFCVGCHDGSTAVSREMCVDGRARRNCHPVELIYPMDPGRFHPASSVGVGLPLTYGKITCESCHSGSDPSNHYLAVNPSTGELCLRCHNK